VTGETRANGSLLLTKGIVRPADPIQVPPPEAAQREPAGAEPETASSA
jgi:hypothetical protein